MEKISISKIRKNPDNPRIIRDDNFKKLVKSLKDFPEMMELRPVVVNREMIILGGNMRYEAAKVAGWKDIPVTIAELTPEQEREFIIKDNVSGGEWDFDLLANEWNAEELKDWGVDLPDMFGENVEAKEDDYEIPNEIETDIIPGDLFEIGRHRLLCGDSTDSDAVAKLMNGEKADMVFTDPPYGLGGYGGRNKMNLKNDDANDEVIALFYSLPIYLEARECYLWGNAKNLFKHIKTEPRDVIVWRKNNFGLGRGYRGQYELCFYYGEFNGSDSDVWDVDKDTKYEHPTQKPIALCVRAIKNSNPKNIVDIFMGSGGTMVAAEQLNIRCYGMEIDPKYCQVVIDRMKKLNPEIEIKKNGVKL